jgi:hypothetical protein
MKKIILLLAIVSEMALAGGVEGTGHSPEIIVPDGTTNTQLICVNVVTEVDGSVTVETSCVTVPLAPEASS